MMAVELKTDVELESLDKYVEDDIFSVLLRCSLFMGAIFQLICLASSVLLKCPKEESNGEEGECSEEQKSSGINGRLQKLRKQEKKKRR